MAKQRMVKNVSNLIKAATVLSPRAAYMDGNKRTSSKSMYCSEELFGWGYFMAIMCGDTEQKANALINDRNDAYSKQSAVIVVRRTRYYTHRNLYRESKEERV